MTKFKKCSGQVVPQYRIKKTTINSSSNPAADGINRIAVDGELYTYLSYEEIGTICFDCLKKECVGYYEARK
jgi:hypothetical protein